MDVEPDRHEHNMERWTFAGSLGVVAGPLALGAAGLLGMGWRELFLFFAGLTVILPLLVWRRRRGRWRRRWRGGDGDNDGAARSEEANGEIGFVVGIRGAWRALRRGAALADSAGIL